MSTEQVPVRIRAAGPWDAAALLDLKRRLDSETSFMMFEPGERDSSVQDRLYERMGFTVEGRRVECLLVDGQLIDELTMAAILPVDAAELNRNVSCRRA